LQERIAQVRAVIVAGGGGADHDQAQRSFVTGRIATPMALYPEYRETRTSFGIDVLGSVVVEVESESGVIGIGVSTGGLPAAFLVERHLARFVEGERADRIELMWDRMWRASLFYGRKGLAVNAISAVDLALWDLLGRLRGEPVMSLIGGAVHDELAATRPARGRISPTRWGSSAASCLCAMDLATGKRASAATSRRPRR
jgi:L-rhamnonate dehydratase